VELKAKAAQKNQQKEKEIKDILLKFHSTLKDEEMAKMKERNQYKKLVSSSVER